MKRNNIFLTVIIFTLMVLMLAACGKSECSVTETTEKQMSIMAQNASKDSFFLSGGLEVADGEKVVITSGLKKGSVRVELIEVPGEQSIDELPDLNSEPRLSANLKASEETSGTLPAGSYMVRATCLEKTTGTVLIEIKPEE